MVTLEKNTAMVYVSTRHLAKKHVNLSFFIGGKNELVDAKYAMR